MKHAIFKFGDRVDITEKYYRSSPKPKYRKWKLISYKKENCIYLGLRLLQNGETYYDEGYFFDPEEYFKAALVCPNKNTNPIYVPLDTLKYSKGY